MMNKNLKDIIVGTVAGVGAGLDGAAVSYFTLTEEMTSVGVSASVMCIAASALVYVIAYTLSKKISCS